MKKSLFVIAMISCCILPVEGLSTSAESVILMELESGRILYEDNGQEEKLIASITKLLTALVAVESGIPLQEMVEITEESYGVEGSSLYLELGETRSLEGLLYGLLLHSGNDAAIAIAIACGGTEENFVEMMNHKAADLSMTQSHFANPHGLNDENHYSTAYDMALLARECLKNQVVAEMVATENIHIDGRSFTNKNKLLWSYEGCIGMKTGYTEQAGRTLVSAAQRDGMTLICVTLNDRNDWVDHSALYDYGFETYEMVEFGAGITAEVPCEEGLVPFVTVGSDTVKEYPLTVGEEVSWDLEEEPTVGSMVKGAESGLWAVFSQGEKELFRLPLVYQEEYKNIAPKPEGFWQKLFAK